MSTNIYKLRDSILELIKDNDYDFDDLKSFIKPVDEFTKSSSFVRYIFQIVEEFIRDRDGNNVFNVYDLELLGTDIIGISTIVSSILLIINAIPQFNLEYSRGDTEEIIFKVLAYVFLVVVPKETGNPWDNREKAAVVNLVLAIYQVILSSQMAKNLVDKITKWFKSKGWCKCLFDDNKEDVVDEHLPELKVQLRHIIQKNRETVKLKNEVKFLKEDIRQLREITNVDRNSKQSDELDLLKKEVEQLKQLNTVSESVEQSDEIKLLKQLNAVNESVEQSDEIKLLKQLNAVNESVEQSDEKELLKKDGEHSKNRKHKKRRKHRKSKKDKKKDDQQEYEKMEDIKIDEKLYNQE